MPQLGTSELMSLVRRGAQTLAHPEIDVNEMLNWNWETMLEECKESSAVPTDDPQPVEEKQTEGSPEDEEQRWLSSLERVECDVLSGKKHARYQNSKNDGDLSAELNREDRRVGKNVTVMIDGFAINKESLNCADWEAVPTFAGKDARLAEPKREKKAEIHNQDVRLDALPPLTSFVSPFSPLTPKYHGFAQLTYHS